MLKNIIKKLVPKAWIERIKLKNIGAYKVCSLLNKTQRKSYRSIIKSGKFWDENILEGGCNYPEITFYIIRRDSRFVGLFSIYLMNLAHIRYAIEHGYVPVIDMQYYRNNYHDNTADIGRVNTWEYYFEQPTKYTLQEAYSGKNVILCRADVLAVNYPTDGMSLFNNENKLLDLWRQYAVKYINIRKDLFDDIEKEWQELTKGEKTLGVFVRGTDYIKLKPPMHPIQPDIDKVIVDIDRVAENYGKIFISTEDVSMLNCLQNRFGDQCITNKREYVKYTKGNTPNISISRENDSYLQGKEYLTNIVMLSKCDGIIAGRASGSVGAMILSKGEWDYSLFYDLGRYPKPE